MTNEDVPSIGVTQVWLEVLLALLVLKAITAIKQQE
jgi:energy-converting hydrogenase Eha subunit E